MANITFNGFSLQDENFITSNINYRTLPTRSVETEQIARRAGVRLLNSEYGARSVKITGSIIADSPEDLQEKIDDFNRSVSSVELGAFEIDDDRSGNAVVVSCDIGDSSYNQSYVPFDLSLLMPDPFFYKSQHRVSLTVASGTTFFETTITLSGSHPMNPSIFFSPPTGIGFTGFTTTSGITIEYSPLGERVTWSGSISTPRMPYSSQLLFDYDNSLIVLGDANQDSSGIFSNWEPKTISFNVSFSGACQGGTLDFIYQPRYL